MEDFFTEELWFLASVWVEENGNGDGRRWDLCRKEDEATVVQRSGRNFCRAWERKKMAEDGTYCLA